MLTEPSAAVPPVTGALPLLKAKGGSERMTVTYAGSIKVLSRMIPDSYRQLQTATVVDMFDLI